MLDNFREWIAEKLSPAQPAIAAQEHTAGPVYIQGYKAAYEQIEIIHRAINMIISALVEIPILVEPRNDAIENPRGPVKSVDKMLNFRPNPFEPRYSFFRDVFLDYFLDGNAFIYYHKEGKVIHRLPANNIEIIADPVKFVSHYNYLIHDNKSDMFGFKRDTKDENLISFLPEEIIHIKNDSQHSTYRGEPILENIQTLIELYDAMIKFQRQFFKNNATPGLILINENVMSQKVKDRILNQWRSAYGLFDGNSRNTAILDGGLKIDKLSNGNFHELDFESSIDRIQQDMAKALGVPYVLMKSGNNANILPNQKVFYLHTVLPILNIFCSAFNLKFPDLNIIPDTKKVMILQPELKEQANYYSTLVAAGIITRNEAREGLGIRCLDEEECGVDMDEIVIPENVAGSAVDPATGGRPPGKEGDE